LNLVGIHTYKIEKESIKMKKFFLGIIGIVAVFVGWKLGPKAVTKVKDIRASRRSVVVDL